MSLIRLHEASFYEFGTVAFQTRPSKAKGGGGDGVAFAILNENQCYLLLTLVRNSKATVPLKTRLIAALEQGKIISLFRFDADMEALGHLQEKNDNGRKFLLTMFSFIATNEETKLNIHK